MCPGDLDEGRRVLQDGIDSLGLDADPEAKVERHIKIGWGLVGLFVSLGICSFFLKRYGISFFPTDPSLMDWAKTFAVVVGFLNLLAWMWFPLEDFRILRHWIRTTKRLFPFHTSEFFSILLAMVLLLLLIVSAMRDALVFSLAGFGVYFWNLLGYDMIRRKLAKPFAEAEKLFGEQPAPRNEPLQRGIGIIRNYWCLHPNGHWLRNRQQIRHGLLALSFLIGIVFAVVGRLLHIHAFAILSYCLGVVTIFAAEVSIAVWRTHRDRALTEIEEELRGLQA
jgi:hypothetical protein